MRLIPFTFYGLLTLVLVGCSGTTQVTNDQSVPTDTDSEFAFQNGDDFVPPPSAREKVFAYVTLQGTREIAYFEIQPFTGLLSEKGRVGPLEGSLVGLTIDREHRMLYAASYPTAVHPQNKIYSFRIDPETGALTQTGTYTEPAEEGYQLGARYIQIHPRHPEYLYVPYTQVATEGGAIEEGRIVALKVDFDSGALSRFSSEAYEGSLRNPMMMGVNPSSEFLYVSNLGGSNDANYYLSEVPMSESEGFLGPIANLQTQGNRYQCAQFHPILDLMYFCQYNEDPQTGKYAIQLGLPDSEAPDPDRQVLLEDRPWKLEFTSDARRVIVATRTNSQNLGSLHLFELNQDGSFGNELIQKPNDNPGGSLDIEFSADNRFLYTADYGGASDSEMHTLSVYRLDSILSQIQKIEMGVNAHPREIELVRFVLN